MEVEEEEPWKESEYVPFRTYNRNDFISTADLSEKSTLSLKSLTL